MSKKQKLIFWPGVFACLICFSTLAVIAGRRSQASRVAQLTGIVAPVSYVTSQPPENKNSRARNLSSQPEAFNLSRRLGRRFSPNKRDRSTLIGIVTMGADRKIVNTIRRQTDDGEQVQITIAGSGILSWDSIQGALSSGTRAQGADRELIERLVLDSPDQFVLAQLRGASYHTVARNLRPADAGDGYSGPLWNVVRVDDPAPDPQKRPLSRWRLYYINTSTGLIDRIVGEVDGIRMVAEISGWSDAHGEKVPTEITWTRQGQTVMHYRLTNFSHSAQ